MQRGAQHKYRKQDELHHNTAEKTHSFKGLYSKDKMNNRGKKEGVVFWHSSVHISVVQERKMGSSINATKRKINQ